MKELSLIWKIFEDINPFCEATNIPVLNFWWCLCWVWNPGWIPLLECFISSSDSPPVLRLPTILWPAWLSSPLPTYFSRNSGRWAGVMLAGHCAPITFVLFFVLEFGEFVYLVEFGKNFKKWSLGSNLNIWNQMNYLWIVFFQTSLLQLFMDSVNWFIVQA